MGDMLSSLAWVNFGHAWCMRGFMHLAPFDLHPAVWTITIRGDEMGGALLRSPVNILCRLSYCLPELDHCRRVHP